MLPLSILMFVLAISVGGLVTYGSISAGGMVFATGFLLIAVVAMANALRARTPTVF